MLTIMVPESEIYNEATNEFVYTKETTLRLEHSLVSISKWESKWKKPFLGKEKKTREEALDYVKCMTTTQNVPDTVYMCLTSKNYDEIGKYIEDSKTATWFSDDNNKPSSEVVTSELIYYWMTAFNIPFECQKWHLNRLLTLIKICSIKNQPKGAKKMSRSAVMKQNSALNKARRARSGSKG